MKKSLLILLTLFCVLLAACGAGTDSAESLTQAQTIKQSSTEAPTEAITEKPTEVPSDPQTEEPTERPHTVITQSTGETPPVNGDGYFTYTNSKYGWSIDIPEIWNEYGFIFEDDETGTVRFTHEASRLSEYHMPGDVFTLMTAPIDKDITGNWGDTELSRNGEFKVYWDKPSDLRYVPDYEEEYRALFNTREEIFASIRW